MTRSSPCILSSRIGGRCLQFSRVLLLYWLLPLRKSSGWVSTRARLPMARNPRQSVSGWQHPMNRLSEDNVDAGCVANARMAAGLDKIVRCAATDKLSTKATQETTTLSPVEEAILQHTGLILDLRSPSERNETQARTWMTAAGFEVKELTLESNHPETLIRDLVYEYPRLVLRLDILSPSKFMDYLENAWLSGPDKIKANMYKLVDGGKLHALRMQTLNQRGLLGLNEAILETGKVGFCTALQAITLHLEKIRTLQTEDTANLPELVAIHCVQGKDRTGLLVMLCQVLLDVTDSTIIEDYYKSHYHKKQKTKDASIVANVGNNSTSAAMELATATTRKSGTGGDATKLDRSIFHSAPKEVMQQTLQYLRSEYGSIVPGYLDHIGFDSKWQTRFRQAAGTSSASSIVYATPTRIVRSKL